jgi:hypothetical protein
MDPTTALLANCFSNGPKADSMPESTGLVLIRLALVALGIGVALALAV